MASPLPIHRPSRTIRRSRTARWRAAALVGVHVLIALHIAHWLIAGRTVTPVEPSEAMAFSKAGIVNAGLIFFAATILLTAVFGRWFCGWGCHLVALQDLARWLLEKIGIRPRPLRSRMLVYVPLIAFVYMFLWPIAYRLWIGDSFALGEVELTTSHFWATFPGWLIGGATFLVCGFAIVYFLGAKGFCTYACPYGAIFAIADRVSPMRIRVTDACAGCGHCTAVCTSNVRVHEEVRDYGMVVDPGCMKCRDCVSVCPQDALYYGLGPISLGATPRRAPPTDRPPQLAGWQEALLGVAFAAAFFTFRGLYGAVPFLMSLGVAAICAYLVLTAAELWRRPHVARRRIGLKKNGRLLAGGWAFAVLFLGLVAFWGHSAWIRYNAYRGERLYLATAELSRDALALGKTPTALGEDDRDRVARARGHLERVRDHGLVATAGNAARLARLYALEGTATAARRAAATALERGESPADMYRLIGRDALAGNDLGGALASYQHAVEVSPQRRDLRVDLGIVLAQAGRLSEADDIFAAALADFPDDAQVLYNAALVQALQGDHGLAIDFLQRVLEQDPEHLAARENLAGLLASTGRFEESISHFRQALARSPDDTTTRFLLARALVASNRPDEALLELEVVLRREPGHAEAQALLAGLRPAS